MKKLSLLVSIMFVLIISSCLVEAADISVTLVSQSPSPVEPGQTVKVRFKIENDGEETISDAVVKLLPTYPLSMYSSPSEKNIGALRGYATGNDAVFVEFVLKVDENATEEEVELELEVLTGETGVAFIDDEFMIDIQTHDAVLDIVSISSEPEEIAPGNSGEVNILVKNVADSLLKDIKFKLDFTDDDIPLSPYKSSSERRIFELETNHQKYLTFKIIADPSAVSGLYKVPMTITYNDEKGTSYSVSDILTILVGEKPKLTAYIKKSSMLQAKKGSKVTIEIANTGTTDVKFLELTILPSENYQLLTTSNYFYLGDVDSDDTESEEIEIYFSKRVKTLEIPIQLKYYDANNKNYQQNFNLNMNLYSSGQLKKFGILEKSKAGSYLFLIILIVGGIFLYRKYRKDPKEFSKWISELKNKLLVKLRLKKRKY